MQRVADSARTNQINYLFAESLHIFQDPTTGRALITVDSAVAEQYRQLGYQPLEFDTVRSLAELEHRAAGIEHRRAPEVDNGAELEAEIQHDTVQEAVDQVLAEPPRIAHELTKVFRNDVMGAGNVSSFWPRLRAAVKEPFAWQGQTYAPLMEWTQSACKEVWKDKDKAERERWEQAVMEMKQVHVFLSMHAAGEVEWDVGANGCIESASFTKVRSAMKAFAKQCALSGGRLDYESLCVKY